jgi:hypothetical protein
VDKKSHPSSNMLGVWEREGAVIVCMAFPRLLIASAVAISVQSPLDSGYQED